jgi:hypothetical protein
MTMKGDSDAIRCNFGLCCGVAATSRLGVGDGRSDARFERTITVFMHIEQRGFTPRRMHSRLKGI